MKRVLMLSLVAVLFAAPATSVTVQCINGNCTESDAAPPAFGFNLGSIFPLFGPVDFDADKDREPVDDVNNPVEPATNETQPAGGVFSIRIMRVFSLRDPSQQESDQPQGLDQPKSDVSQPMDFGPPPLLLQKLFDNMFADMGILDLSGKQMKSEEVYNSLAARKAEGRPVRVLILSNSRVTPMDAGTFAPAEDTINTLVMANTSVNLDALRGLTNLKSLNLSNNGLSTFPWYGLMASTLEVLDLSNNKFEEIRPELSMLKGLRELYLSNNKIMDVEAEPLSLLPNLETLDLSMNVLLKANLAGLKKLNRLNVDWNFLRLMGADLQLPSQPLTLKLSSNPWRCDCGLLQARDSNEILDLDQLQCVNHNNVDDYAIESERKFLPDQDGKQVAFLTKDAIGHQGCKDFSEFYKYLSGEFKDSKSTSLVQDFVLFIIIFVFLLICIFKLYVCRSTVDGGKVWIRPQEIPKWTVEKLGKQEEIPYIKMDKTPIKA